MSKAATLSQAKKSVKRLEKLQEDLAETYEEVLGEIAKRQIKKIKTILNKQKDLKNTRIKLEDFATSEKAAIKKLTDAILGAYDSEKSSLESSIAMAKQKSPAAIRAMFKHLTESDIQDIITKMNNGLLYLLYESLDQVADVEVLVSLLENSATKTVKAARAKSSVLPAKAVNTARQQYFNENFDEIESYTFYNPSPVAEICRYLAGRTVAANDPLVEMYQPPLHYNCSTVLLPNLKTTKGNPKAEPIAPNEKQLDSMNIGVKDAAD